MLLTLWTFCLVKTCLKLYQSIIFILPDDSTLDHHGSLLMLMTWQLMVSKIWKSNFFYICYEKCLLSSSHVFISGEYTTLKNNLDILHLMFTVIHSMQCTRKTFMIHQTFVRWALYILLKFVKSLIRHLGLAIGNVGCVRCFSWTLFSASSKFNPVQNFFILNKIMT